MRFNKYFIMFILILIGSSILGYASKNSKDISIDVAGVNAETVGLYEKFEIEVYIQGASYTNPYDPAQIDIRAVITSPSDSVWNIFGFYDDFQDIDKWKVRFSANETGEWSYYLTAVNGTDSAQSTSYVFTVTESDHHGWLMISPDNPHYFIHDDGTSFFGVGAYYPWGVDNSATGLGRLEEHGANMFGYWNIMYGGEGNIIESLDSGLGRYDQSKCGRIDMILGWAEERNMIMMFAFWPHDLLSNTVWAHQWHNNPYKDICDVEDFFADETAWFYQERQYRYLIARWGYSRSLGIWEIVNEINGTDGWEAGNQTEATNWVANVHQFFKENDPFKSPTTASMSGGHYWSEGYAEVDIPNVHLYESGWPQQYPGNPLRSSLWTYYNVTGQFRNDFQKPAILGEAGYTDTYGNFNVPSDEYTKLYHNALWVTWAGGLSMTPVWWDYGSVNIMSDEVMDQMLSFSMIVNKVDYAGYSSEHVNVVGMDCDGFAMKNSQTGWGWVREVNDNSIQG
ncbi:MAG: DUF5060 domain-containing protein, partial [Calditrichia bacterium]|nr:DUF5060 domain-containing protein [Calditrichia bacterium]